MFRLWDKVNKIMVYPDNENYDIKMCLNGEVDGYSYMKEMSESKDCPGSNWYVARENSQFVVMLDSGLSYEIREGVTQRIYADDKVELLRSVINYPKGKVATIVFRDGAFWLQNSELLRNVIGIIKLVGNIYEGEKEV